METVKSQIFYYQIIIGGMGALMITLFSFLLVIICHYHKKHKRIATTVSHPPLKIRIEWHSNFTETGRLSWRYYSHPRHPHNECERARRKNRQTQREQQSSAVANVRPFLKTAERSL